MPRFGDPVQIWAPDARSSWFPVQGDHKGNRPGAGSHDPARPKRLATTYEANAAVKGSEE